jgi:hypothetical protein
MSRIEGISVLFWEREPLALVQGNDEDAGFRGYHGYLSERFGGRCHTIRSAGRIASRLGG